MDLLQLKYFQTVARHQHMTHAADELHVAQPSLSKVIARLEENLGTSLFDRQGRHIKLNKFGSVFLHRIDNIFLELEAAKQEIAEMIGNEKLKISIASNCMSLFPKLIERYLELYPGTSFQQTSDSVSNMRHQLEQGDVQFCISSPPIEGEHIKCIPLLTEELFLLVSQQHRFAGRDNIDLSEAINEPFVALNEGYCIQNFCAQAGFTPNIIYETGTAWDIFEMVNLNLGIALLPLPKYSYWENLSQPKPVPLRITQPVCSRSTSLSYMQNRYLPQEVAKFKDYVVDYFRGFTSP